MKKTLIILVFLFSTSISSLVCGADFQKGLDAAIKGDYATALEEWIPLAKQGDSESQYNLGVMYENGQGVSQDDQEAVKWYQSAAEQDHPQAQYNLGLMYKKGQGVTQDYQKALKWFHLSAEQAYPPAQVMLGTAYILGEGVKVDPVIAYMWFNIASKYGYEIAIKTIDEFKEYLTIIQLRNAQTMTKICMRNNFKDCDQSIKPEFSIAGLSLGDSLLNYYSEEEIENNVQKEYYKDTDNKFSALELNFSPPVEEYDAIQIILKTGDKQYKIYGIDGIITFKENVNDCYKKQIEMADELSAILQVVKRVDGSGTKHPADESGKSIVTGINFLFKSGNVADITCYDWSEEKGNIDQMRMGISSQEYFEWTKEWVIDFYSN